MATPQKYTVQKGDTLSGIATKYGLNWQNIAKSNGIADPRKLQIGTNLSLGGSTPQNQTQQQAPQRSIQQAQQQQQTPLNRFNPKTDQRYQQGMAREDKYQGQYDNLFEQLKQLTNKDFQYNPETDPSYQAYQQLAQKQAQTASKGALETMNDRGIINSSVTSNQLGQIQQSAQDSVTALIPQLQRMAQQERQQNIGNVSNLADMASGSFRDQRGFNEGYRRYEEGQDMEEDRFNYRKEQDTLQREMAQEKFDRSKMESDRAYNLRLAKMKSSGGSGGGSGGGGKEYSHGRKLNYNETYSLWKQRFGEHKKSEVDNYGGTQGIIRIEDKYFNDPTFVENLISEGYNTKAVKDALYGAYSDGQWGTKKDFQGWYDNNYGEGAKEKKSSGGNWLSNFDQGDTSSSPKSDSGMSFADRLGESLKPKGSFDRLARGGKKIWDAVTFWD